VKKKIMILSGLFLLSVVIVYIIWDLFYKGQEKSINPYELDVSGLKKMDTLNPSYSEVLQFQPVMSIIYGISSDRYDRIYIGGSGGIEVFGASGNPVFSFATQDTVRCLAVDSAGFILLGLKDHIAIYTPKGKLAISFPQIDKHCIITSIAIAGDDIYAADAGTKIVYRFNRSGKVVNKIGAKDPAQGIPGFIVPSPYFDLGITKDGSLWVVNPGRHSFEQYHPDGTLITTWEKSSTGIDGFFGCCNPGHFAFLSDGNIVTSEKGIERIKVYDQKGNLLHVVALPGSFDEGIKGLDLAVDSRNRILVLDPIRHQVRIFEKTF
jgi:hypothetical protein